MKRILATLFAAVLAGGAWAAEPTHVLVGPGPSGPWTGVPIEDVIPPAPLPPADSAFVPAGYVRTFTDEFDDPQVFDAAAVNSARWIGCWKKWNVCHLANNNDQALKVVTSATHQKGTAGMVLNGLNQPATGQSGGQQITLPYTGAMISAEVGHGQKWGYWEVRVRINGTKGHHFALWLLHKDGSYEATKEVAEVDLLETVNGEKKLHFNSHGPGEPAMTTVAGDPREWHVIGLLMDASGMRWHLDGKQVRSSPRSMPREVYFLASQEIGGKWPGSPDGTTKWPFAVEIDYVRIYAKTN